jgi:molybdenum cofactor biosynthesis enzyme MoaA
VRVALTTNGSYLTPRELERLADVRFEHVTVSLNAASAETYARVNRGLPLARVRENLDALLAGRARDGSPESISYSMVILRENLHEIADFAALAEGDGVGVRFMLPMHDRNGQSFLTDAKLMRDVELRLRDVAARLSERGSERDARRVRGEADVLSLRLARGVLRPLPDDDLVELRRS